MKKLIYICNTRFPTEKAHGLATAKICEAFADAGYEVQLIIPRLWRRSSQDLFSYYGIQRKFLVTRIPCLDFLNIMPLPALNRITFLIQIVSFSVISFFYLLYSFGRTSTCVFFSHDYIPLYFASLIAPRVFYDIHHFPGRNFMYRRLMHHSFGFAVQTKWKITELENKWGIAKHKVVYWPNGTEVEKFATNLSRTEARQKLGLPTSGAIGVYTGQLFPWKGVDTLIRAVAHMKQDIQVYIVGGTAQDVLDTKGRVKESSDPRIHFVDFRPHQEMPLWLTSANVLILPNTGTQKVSLYYTSPMKLFEYMASGTPIVASRIPSIEEILHDENSVLVLPDDPQALAAGIEQVIQHDSVSRVLSERAQKDVRAYTWQARAEKILSYMNAHE